MAIWRWQDGAKGQNHGPTASALRKHGVVRGGIALPIACAFWLTHHTAMATLVAGIGTFTLLAALVSPHGLYARLTALLDRFAYRVGIALTWLVLVPIYVLVLTPIGWTMRTGSRDPLRRHWTALTPSFWTDRPATDDAPERRKRPF